MLLAVLISDLEEVVIRVTPYEVWGKACAKYITSKTLHKDNSIRGYMLNLRGLAHTLFPLSLCNLFEVDCFFRANPTLRMGLTLLQRLRRLISLLPPQVCGERQFGCVRGYAYHI